MNWYYISAGDTVGPVTAQTLKQLATSGNIKPLDKVRNDKMTEWVEARQVRGLFPDATATRPTSPGGPPPFPPPPPPPMPARTSSQSSANQPREERTSRSPRYSRGLIIGLGSIVIAISCIAVWWLFFGGRDETRDRNLAGSRNRDQSGTAHIDGPRDGAGRRLASPPNPLTESASSAANTANPPETARHPIYEYAEMPVSDLPGIKAAEAIITGDYRKPIATESAKKHQVLRAGFFQAHESPVTCIAFSPDGKLAATGSRDWTVQVWNVADRESLLTLAEHKGGIKSVQFSFDGTAIATIGKDGATKVWDALTGRLRANFKSSVEPSSVTFSQDGRTVASGFENGDVRAWDCTIGDGKQVAEFSHSDDTATSYGGAVTTLLFSPDDKQIVAASNNGRATVWSMPDGRRLAEAKFSTGTSHRLLFSLDGKLVVDGKLCVFDVESGRELRRIDLSYGTAMSGMTLTNDGKTLGIAAGKRILLFDVKTETQKAVLVGHEKNITTIAVCPDASSVLSADEGKWLKFWTIEPPNAHITIPVAQERCSVLFEFVHTELEEESMKPWDEIAQGYHSLSTSGSDPDAPRIDQFPRRNVGEKELREALKGNRDHIWGFTFTPDSRSIVIQTSGGVSVWEVATGKLFNSRKRKDGDSHFMGRLVGVLPNGESIVMLRGQEISLVDLETLQERISWTATKEIANFDRGIMDGSGTRIIAYSGTGRRKGLLSGWDASNGKELWRRSLSEPRAWSISHDGRFVATYHVETIELFEAQSGKQHIASIWLHGLRDNFVALSPDGFTLAIPMEGTTLVQVPFRAETNKLPKVNPIRTINLTSHAFSPDGKLLAMGGQDQCIYLWNVAQDKVVHTLRGHVGLVKEVQFSPDGKIVATTDEMGYLRLFTLPENLGG